MGAITLLPTCVHHTQRHCFEKAACEGIKPARSPRVLGPPPLPLLTITVKKRSTRDRLGLSFMPEPVDGGALVSALEFGSLAWRSQLRPGDIVKSIVIDGAEHAMEGGYRAAQILRPAKGLLRLRVRRRKPTAEEIAAQLIQAALRGMRVRSAQHILQLAATHIQAAWRRAAAVIDYEDALWAAELIQYVTRQRLERRRRERAARRPVRIRSPPCLECDSD
jgi:hypothetical protein